MRLNDEHGLRLALHSGTSSVGRQGRMWRAPPLLAGSRKDGWMEDGWKDGWKEAKGEKRKAGEPMIKGAKQQRKRSMNQIDVDEDENFTGGDMKKQSGNRLISGHTK